MEPLPYPEVLKLPQAQACARKDNPKYLADCVVREIQAGNTTGLPADFILDAGIGRLTAIGGSYTFESYAKKVAEMAEPSLVALAVNFTDAVAVWAGAGFPVATNEEYARRSAICALCPFWDPGARIGLGICKHAGCGCTKFKRWLATATCPDKKW